MNRRKFIKSGLIFVPTYLAGQKLIAQPSLNGPTAGVFNQFSGSSTPSLQQSLGGGGGTNTSLANDSTRVFLATQFTSSSGYTLTRADLELSKNNSPTGQATAYLYSDSGGSPGSLLATSSNTINLATVTSSFVYYQFNFSDYLLSNSTLYHIAISKSSGSVDGTHYVKWNTESSGGSGVEKSPDGASWTVIGAAYRARVNLYGF